MKRLVNARFFLFAAIGLVLGILCGHSIMFGKWVLPILLVCVVATTLVTLLILKNKLYLVVLFVFIFTFLGCGLFQAKLFNLQTDEVIARPVTLTGRVTDIGRMGKNTNVLYLEKCTYDDVKIDGRVKVIVFDGSSFQTGEVLTLNGTLRSTYIFADNFDTSCLRNNCRYQLTDISIVARKSGTLTLGESVRKYIFNRCQNYMFSHSGLMYALITGDSNAMDNDVLHMYQASGMVHLIAVSGMHLVYIITIIGFFINKLKLHPLAEFAIMIGPLVFFCYICNWAPSILRALLMTVCTYLVKCLCGRYDMLIALSWSVLILLLANPFYLFDIGWQLSVMSVFGMATLHLRLDRFLKRQKLSKWMYALLSSLALSLSCTVATFATVAYYFGEVPILGVFANLIGVPLMSWAFTVGLVGLLPWVFGYSLHIGDGILWVVTQEAKLISSLDVAVVHLSAVALAIAVTIVWLYVAGQYVNLKKFAKVAVNCTLCVILVVCFVAAAIPVDCQDQVFVDVNFDGADVVVTTAQGDVMVLSNCQSAYAFSTIKSKVQKLRYKSLTWVFYDMSKYDFEQVDVATLHNLGVQQVYNLSHQTNNVALQSFQSVGIPVKQVANNQTIGTTIKVQSVYDGSLSGAVVTVGEMMFAIVLGNDEQTREFVQIQPNANFYVVKTPTPNYLEGNLVTFSLYQDYCDTNYGANKYGNFTITQKDGTILVNF